MKYTFIILGSAFAFGLMGLFSAFGVASFYPKNEYNYSTMLLPTFTMLPLGGVILGAVIARIGIGVDNRYAAGKAPGKWDA